MVQGLMRLLFVATASVAMFLFVVSGTGCNGSQKAAPHEAVAKPMATDHDHSAHGGHEHGTAGQNAADDPHAAHGMAAGHDHAAHKHAAAEHETAPSGTPEISQETCPVMGEEIDSEVFTVHEGRKVYFCCEKCIAKFKKDPAKYLAKLNPGA